MPAPGAILTAAFAVVWVVGLLIGMAYLRGGREAVRVVLPRFAIIVPLAVLLFLVESFVSNRFSNLAVGVVLLPVVFILLGLQIRRYRRLRATAPDDVRASVAITPAIRNFAIVAFVIGTVGSILLAFLAARAGL
jgi:hypothetical protein